MFKESYFGEKYFVWWLKGREKAEVRMSVRAQCLARNALN